MILHTTEVQALPDYRLFLCFNDGTGGEVSLAGALVGEVFEALRDPSVFATAKQHPRCARWHGPTVRTWHLNTCTICCRRNRAPDLPPGKLRAFLRDSKSLGLASI